MPNRFEINPSLPIPNFKEKYLCEVELQYEIIGGIYEFRYRTVLYKIIPGAAPTKVDEIPWTPFLRRDQSRSIVYREFLDIDIKFDDALVVMKTVDNRPFVNLYWSQVKSALVTKRNRQHIYGLLEYYYNGQWTTTIPQGQLCREMRFRARYNRRNTLSRHSRHGFALNVLLNNSEEEIDPDIKNPSA